MRKYTFLSTLLISASLLSLFHIMSFDVATVYSQDIADELPDLTGSTIYFSEASNELSQFDRSGAGISRFAGLLKLAGANLNTLEWRNGIPPDADLIIISAPNSDLTADIVARLWSYLQDNGKILIIADAFDDRNSVSRALTSGGFFGLTWNDIGIRARDDVLVMEGESRAIDVVERDRDGNVVFEFSGQAPTLITQFYTSLINSDHPITADMSPLLGAINTDVSGTTNENLTNFNSFYFNGARSIEIGATLDEATITPLIFTNNEGIYGEIDFVRYLENGYVEYNIGEDSQRDTLMLAAAYDNPSTDSRMVLIGDGDFIRNGTGFVTSPSYSDSFVYPMNVQFALSSVTWLLDQTPIILDLPTPMATPTATITPTPLPTVPSTTDSG